MAGLLTIYEHCPLADKPPIVRRKKQTAMVNLPTIYENCPLADKPRIVRQRKKIQDDIQLRGRKAKMSELGIEPPVHYNGHRISMRNPTSPNTRALCNCCPYGYHIDLGFVEFCDRLAKENRENRETNASKRERRERRRQRQSMEVLLGLTNPVFWNLQQFLPALFLRNRSRHKNKKADKNVSAMAPRDDSPPLPPPRKSSLACDSDALKKAVQDFEATLERTTKRSPRHLTAIELDTETIVRPKEDSMKKNEARLLENATPIFTTNNTTAPLKNIREQMAMSLEKMRDLENKVKSLPILENQIIVLKEEKSDLSAKLTELHNQLHDEKEKSKNLQLKLSKPSEKKPVIRDIGILCSAITRDVGFSPVTVKVRNILTETDFIEKFEKSTDTNDFQSNIDNKKSKRISLKDLDTIVENSKAHQRESKSTQVNLLDTTTILKVIEKRDCGVQVEQSQKITRDVGVTVKAKMIDVGVEHKVNSRDIGVSDDKIVDVLCDRCRNVKTKSIGIGMGNVKDQVITMGIGNRSKSFDITKKHTRNIGVSTIPPAKKLTATKLVGTIDLSTPRKNIAVNTNILKTREVGTLVNDLSTCEKCEECTIKKVEKKEREIAKESHKSKIPRPAGATTPVMNKKVFVRQDTYSKTPPLGTIGTPSQQQYRSKLSPDRPEVLEEENVTVTLRKKPEKIEQAIAETEKRISSDLSLNENRRSIGIDRFSGIFDDCGYDYDEQYGDQESNRNSQMFPENALFQPISDKLREKLVPTKEMKAAMKVVNDGLHKYPNGLPKHLKTASNIIQQEWFKISSTASANPLDVEDYLDSFEEVSSTLLEFVVNMVDNNGNTAMHYAVSHGNFDVVSILLDSKVCNINKPNAAGYTCVMLVSLAQVRSDTHRQVVRRLFLLADVNVRAKQHGQTALMLAVSHGRLDMVQLLLDAGADPNIQDLDGSTALMCAAEHGHLDIVKHILAHPDCDASIVDCDGSSALAIAMEAGNRDIGVLLYAREHFAPNSRGNSPYASLKQRRHKSSPSPNPKTPTSPSLMKRSDHSI